MNKTKTALLIILLYIVYFSFTKIVHFEGQTYELNLETIQSTTSVSTLVTRDVTSSTDTNPEQRTVCSHFQSVSLVDVTVKVL